MQPAKPKQNANRLEKRLSSADTSGVVGSRQSHNAVMGRMQGPADRRTNKANNMVSANSSRKRG